MKEIIFSASPCIICCECVLDSFSGGDSKIHPQHMILGRIKDRDSTAPKRGSVFIGLMTPDGAIWSRYQRAVLMR